MLDEINTARKSVADDFTRSMKALCIPSSGPHCGQLCVVATEAGIQVGLGASRRSDEEVNRKADDYCFRFDLPSGVDKRVLEKLQPPALAILLLPQSWVCAVNRMVRKVSAPRAANVVSLTDDICAAAAAFVICLAANPAGSRAA